MKYWNKKELFYLKISLKSLHPNKILLQISRVWLWKRLALKLDNNINSPSMQISKRLRVRDRSCFTLSWIDQSICLTQFEHWLVALIWQDFFLSSSLLILQHQVYHRRRRPVSFFANKGTRPKFCVFFLHKLCVCVIKCVGQSLLKVCEYHGWVQIGFYLDSNLLATSETFCKIAPYSACVLFVNNA